MNLISKNIFEICSTRQKRLMWHFCQNRVFCIFRSFGLSFNYIYKNLFKNPILSQCFRKAQMTYVQNFFRKTRQKRLMCSLVWNYILLHEKPKIIYLYLRNFNLLGKINLIHVNKIKNGCQKTPYLKVLNFSFRYKNMRVYIKIGM